VAAVAAMLKAQTQLPAQVVRVAAQMEQKKEILVLLFCVIQVA
jgi:hypothetical protein